MKRHAFAVSIGGVAALVALAACKKDETNTTTTTTTNTTTTTTTTTTTGTGGAGGGSNFTCVDVTVVSDCSSPDAATCTCVGCDVVAGACTDGTIYNDCVCPTCATDPTCNPATGDTCFNDNPAAPDFGPPDGFCDPYWEGCSCADCADHPLCAGG